jgi:hemoglobin-like flavoprotein
MKCTTHHNACDCREAHFRHVLEVLQRLHDYCGPSSTKSILEWKKAMADAADILKEGRS